jgi:hypothetical protein
MEYSHNPNGKLFADVWSDLRLSNPDKYYPGSELEIIYRGALMGYAKVVAVRRVQFKTLRDALSFLVQGRPAHYTASVLKRMYGKIEPDDMIDHVVLAYTKRNLENQSSLIADWWKTKNETSIAS